MSRKDKNDKKRKSPAIPPVERNIQKRMQLLGFVRGQDQFLALLNDIQQTDQALSQSYRMIRQHPDDLAEEQACLARIRQLEDQRFLLLGQLHGNRVNDYHLFNKPLAQAE